MWYREQSPMGAIIDLILMGCMYYGGRSDGKKAAYAEINEDKHKKEMDKLRAEIQKLKSTR